MSKPQRADAVRNRGRILEAARQLIARHGAEIGMDELAAAAGVAVGTLYRHFPTKSHLVRAVLDEYAERVADEAESALQRVQAGSPAMEELQRYLRWVVRISSTNHAAKAIAEGLLQPALDGDLEARAAQAITRVMESAVRQGGLRSDISIDDVYLIVGTAPYGQPEATLTRWLDLMLPSLRATSA